MTCIELLYLTVLTFPPGWTIFIRLNSCCWLLVLLDIESVSVPCNLYKKVTTLLIFFDKSSSRYFKYFCCFYVQSIIFKYIYIYIYWITRLPLYAYKKQSYESLEYCKIFIQDVMLNVYDLCVPVTRLYNHVRLIVNLRTLLI